MDIRQLERALAARLAGDGWEVAVAHEVQPGRICVAVVHPLLSTYRVFDTHEHSWREDLDRWLASPELQLVRDRPPSMPHMRFVGRLRHVAGVHFWSADELRAVTASLVANAALSSDEARWLDMAGPVGHGDWAYDHFVAERQERLQGVPVLSVAERSRRERGVLADRPSMPHADLVDAVRSIAGAHRWPRRDLASLAEVLWDCEVFTAEELAWLIWVGPPGNQEAAPADSWREVLEGADDECS